MSPWPHPEDEENTEDDAALTPDEDSEESSPDEDDDDFDDEPEFSLTQLSEAYAEVIEAQTGKRPTVDVPAEADNAAESDETESNQENDDNSGCQISPESIIESILFVGAPRDVKLNSRKIAAVLRDVSPKEVTKIVRELNAKYEKENTAYRIKSDGGVFDLVLAKDLLEFQQEYFGRNRQVRLTQAAIEVMAVVAYNQPITRDQVDKLRNKPSGSVLNQLIKRQLITVEPGTENPKVKYYSTTDRFLDFFQLDCVADLPQSHDVSDIAELAD
jgi:segregation and condensation protein B